ncbi:hypothetical protein ACHAXT_012182 [Thalassiosira profunda]
MEEVQYLERQWGKVQLSTRAKKKTRSIPGGVKLIVPSVGHLYTLHLYLGTASHIYLRLNDFKVEGLPPCFTVRGFPELKRKLADLIVSQKWDSWLDIPHRNIHESNLPWQLQVHVTTSKSKLMHTKAVEERVRETIGEVLGIEGLTTGKDKDSIGAKRSPGGERPIVRLLVRIKRDVVQLSLDTSASSAATPLHMRGYRLNPFKAPLREDLAFALLMAGGLKPRWNLLPGDMAEGAGQSTTAKETSLQLLDPFWTNLCDASLWESMKSNAMSNVEQSKVLVAANDLNKGALAAAKANATRAGVKGLIHFTTGSFKVHPLLKPQKQQPTEVKELQIITNPPYGKRLSTLDESKQSTYKELAKALIASPHKLRCTLIGNNPRPLRESALPLEVAFSTKQGGLNVVAFSGSVDSNHRN